MARVTVEGKFPKRIDDFVLYKLNDQVIMRAVSGFTSAAIKTSPKYELSRQNASEFGRVSATCKQLRLALQTVLHKKNNLAVVNCLTKKMRQVLVFDDLAARGERTLARAIATEKGRQQLHGYHFNPDGAIALDFVLQNGIVQMNTASLTFPDDANSVCFSLVALAFDFEAKASSSLESEKQFFNKPTMPNKVDLDVPNLETCAGVLFTILVVRYYVQNDDAYIPVEDDRSTVIVIVD